MMIATKSVRSHDSMVSLPVVAASMAIENIVIRLREMVGSTVSLQGCWHSHLPNLYDA
jgi:nucleoside diphosphate kinase